MERPEDSRNQPSLDEIITRSAATIADQIRGAAALARSEMDLQIDVAAVLKKFASDAKITLEGHHDITIATGRPDSVYGSVIVEYKEPGNLSPNKDAANNRKVIDQLKKRFYDMNREEHRQWRTMFGVGRTASISSFSVSGMTSGRTRNPWKSTATPLSDSFGRSITSGQKANPTSRNTCTATLDLTARSPKKACGPFMKRS